MSTSPCEILPTKISVFQVRKNMKQNNLVNSAFDYVSMAFKALDDGPL